MSEKQKRMWLSAALSAVELLILLLLCNINAYSFSLGFGGERVAALQKALRQSGAYDGEINGLFDIETKNAVKKIFPESEGEASGEVLEKLGLDSGCCGFSAVSELTSRYVSYKMNAVPLSTVKKIINENSISELMWCDYDFFCKLMKLVPSADACDCAYKYENNKKCLK